MKTKRIVLDSFSLLPADGWKDVTRSVEEDDAPFTFARADGVGVLQLSDAVYQGGSRPATSATDLEAMLRDFGAGQELGEPRDVARVDEPLASVGGSFAGPDGFLRVWYVSDGQGFVLATYECQKQGAEVGDLPACEAMVASIRFDVDQDGEGEPS